MRREAKALAAFLAGASLFASGQVAAKPPLSVVYCKKFHGGGAAYLLARERPDGDLDFGFSNWMSNGHLAGIGGTARRVGSGWVYTSMDESSQPGRPCVAHIRIQGAKGARVAAAPLDSCDGNQGVGASVGAVDFPPGAYGGRPPKGSTSVNEDALGPKCDSLK
jgi:hypothetical protein